MKLVFINHIGENFQGYSYYELLFSESSLDEITGDDWDAYPANGNPKVPIDYVDLAFRLETEIEFELIQNHVSFDMSDCKQGIIPLAWESEKDEETIEKRLFFKFGEKLESVKSKLYERDIFIEKIYGEEKQHVD